MKKNFHKFNGSREFRLISVGFFLIAILLLGAFTLAYLSSKDEAANRFHADDVEIELLEPAWRATGEAEAEKLVPGMIIDKDPYVLNVSKSDVYVRMGIQVTVDGKALKKTDAAYKKFIAILCIDSPEEKVGSDDWKSNISGLMNDQQTLSKNEHFVFKNGWFYYVDSTDASKPYKILHEGEATERLFYELHFPVLKKEYIGYFDKPFNISIVAQGVPVKAVKDLSKIDQYFDEYVDSVIVK